MHARFSKRIHPRAIPDARRERGAALILLTLMVATVLIPIVGLAIDGTILFFVKTKLSASVDAAALAGARSLSTGLDLPSQTAAAQATIQSFFSANYPAGFWGTTNATLTTSITQTAYKTRTVDIQAYVDSPLYFMRILGQNTSRVAAHGQTTRRDVNVIMVVDRSGSMNNNNACAAFRAAATQFIGSFVNGRDRIGLLEFGGTTNLDYAPNLNFQTSSPTLATVIGNVVCDGNTNTATGIWEGYQQLQAINEPGALNLILLFTDGRPTALTASFPVKKLNDTRWGWNNYTTAVATPPSTCRDAANRSYPNPQWSPGSITGIVATYTSYWADQGWTWGVDNYHAVSQSNPAEQTTTTAPLAVTSGCSFLGPWDTNANPGQFMMRRDIAYIPDQDFYANSTHGYQPVATFPNGPYSGKIRPDVPSTLRYAAYNAADNAASRIRGDSALAPIFYVIGLGGNDTEGIDHPFLQRIANVPESAIYDSTKPQGLYIYSPTTQQLGDAFARVASEILRISR